MRFFVTTINGNAPIQSVAAGDPYWGSLGYVFEAADAATAASLFATAHGPLQVGHAVRVIQADQVSVFPVTSSVVLNPASTYTPPPVG